MKPLEIGLIGGVEKRDIKIVDYDSAWPNKYEHHKTVIKKVLGNRAIRIEHIGSTAVPLLAAKPIIDILIEVSNSADESIYLPSLEKAGYVLRVREPDWNEHRMLRIPEKDVHIHVYSTGCPEIARNLTFRDRLRSNPQDRIQYEILKRELAKKDWSDMNAYSAAKSNFIENVIDGLGSGL